MIGDVAARTVAGRLGSVMTADLHNATHAARCVACHDVRSHPVPVALVGECARQSSRVLARELEVVALMRHPTLDGANPASGIQPRAERAEHGQVSVEAGCFQRNQAAGVRGGRSWLASPCALRVRALACVA